MGGAALKIFSPAKINLALHVTGRRDDGYHLLDSIVAFADIGDEISIIPADDFTLSITGLFADKLPAERDNLVEKAAHLLSKRYALDLKLNIALTKNLPIAAGIGGGSSNAAATIHGLAQYYELKTIDEDILLALGADVPVCYHGITNGGMVRMGGIGETLETLAPRAPLPALLINPNTACPTKDIFAALKTIDNPPMTQTADLGALRNDLTDAAIAHNPVIRNVLDVLENSGATLSRMSGSGATCFGLYATSDDAQSAAQAIKATHPDWWARPCLINY